MFSFEFIFCAYVCGAEGNRPRGEKAHGATVQGAIIQGAIDQGGN